MTLREAIEQYIVWRRAHGAKFTTGANLLRHFLGYADGDAACDAGHHNAGPGLSGGHGSADPAPREQALCPRRLLAPCNQSRPCERSPLPDNEPRSPVRAPPYIYRARNCAGSSIPLMWRSADGARFSWTRRHSGLCFSCYTAPACASAKRQGSRWRTSILRKAF